MRGLDPLVSAAPVLQAGPAHIATLKTFDPPLRELEGRCFAGAGRRGKWLLFPTADEALQSQQRIRRGRELFATLRCIKCHAADQPLAATAMPELSLARVA